MRRLLLATLTVTLLGLPLAATSAHAADPCTALVVDDAGVLTGDPALTAAAQAAERAGIAARIRTVTSVPGKDIDAYARQLVAACPTWHNPDGSPKSNLLLLAVATADRKTVMTYGSAFDRALGGQWPRIQAALMNPRFGDGDFAAGLTAGLNESARLIDAYQHPGAAPVAAPAAPPVDYSGVVSVLLWILAAIAGVIGIILLIVFPGRMLLAAHRARQAAAAALTAARGQLAGTRTTAQDAFVTVDTRLQELTTSADILKGSVADEDDILIDQVLADTARVVDAASARYLAAVDAHPETGDLAADLDTVTAATTAYEQASAQLDTAATALENAAAQLAEAAARAAHVTARLETARGLVTDARGALTAVSTWDTTALTADLATAARDLDTAETAAAEHRISAASTLLDQVETTARTVAETAAGLPVRADALTAAADTRERSARDLTAAQGPAARALAAGTDTYGPDLLTGPAAELTHAPALLTALTDGIARLRRLTASRNADNLDAGETLAAELADLERDARAATAGVSLRISELDGLAASLPQRLASLDQQIADARRYVAAHADDIDPSRASDLDTARDAAADLHAAAGKKHPDLPSIAARIDATGSDIATALTAAHDDVDTATRARAALTKANAAVADAERRIRSSSGSRATRELAEARTALANARSSGDTALILSLALMATQHADAAQSAHRAQEAAEQAAEQAAQRAQEAAEQARRDSYNSSSGSSFGGSTDWGSGGGGGGSSSW